MRLMRWCTSVYCKFVGRSNLLILSNQSKHNSPHPVEHTENSFLCHSFITIVMIPPRLDTNSSVNVNVFSTAGLTTLSALSCVKLLLPHSTTAQISSPPSSPDD
eukprot:scaffold5470_cov199-Alexandrium_tamarense.AAC.5